MNPFQDWKANKGCTGARLLLLHYRTLRLLASWGILARPLYYAAWVAYKFWVQYLMHVELSPKIAAGAALRLPHPFAIVVNCHTVIGTNCIIRNCVTIGNKGNEPEGRQNCPTIGDNVSIGCNSAIIGAIRIGDNAVIGAGSVVVKDVPANAVAVGNPASAKPRVESFADR
jgi:putative colanic acid biosynthesis acetyltransferase WcaB